MKVFERFCLWLLYVGMAALMVMVIIILVDVIGRMLFHTGIPGGTELEAQLLSIVSFFTLALPQIRKRHILIDYLVQKVRPEIRWVIDLLNFILCALFSTVLTWQTIVQGVSSSEGNVVTPIMNIPVAPFMFIGSLGLAALCIAFFQDFVLTLREALDLAKGKKAVTVV